MFSNSNQNANGQAGVTAAQTLHPIDSLSPFIGGKWFIRARVTDKSDIRRWNKPTTQGQLFSFTLVDESASIRVTVFQDAVDMFFPMIANGSVYIFSGGQIKNANKKFSNVNNDYELSFDNKASIIKQNDTTAIPTTRYNFVPISILKQRETGSTVDVLAVVTSVGECGSITQKATGKELIKRPVKLADTTASIELTLWGDAAKDWTHNVGSVLALRQVRTGSFDGVTLTTSFGTQIDVSPAIPDVKKLSDWFLATGANDVVSLSNQPRDGGNDFMENFHGKKFFDSIQSEGLGKKEKADFIEVRCTPVYIKQDVQWYEACPTCNKKVVAGGADGKVSKCEKCDKVVVAIPRYLISIQASDGLTQTWLSLFQEAGTQFYGMSAQELKIASEADATFLTRLIQGRLHRPALMRLRVKEEAGRPGTEDQNQVKCTVTKITELFMPHDAIDAVRKSAQKNLAAECQSLLENIALYH